MATATSTLDILIKLRDETNTAMKGLSSKFDGLANVAKKSAVAIGAIGVAAGTGLAFAVQAAADAQEQMMRVGKTLENTIENMSDGAFAVLQKSAEEAGGRGADAFKYMQAQIEQASAAAVKLGFDDEDAASSLANLFQRTEDVDKAMELNALAMDLARAKSISLADASNMIGLVMSGNGRALKQYGIEISETLTPMQALDELQKKVGGNARVFGMTMNGQIEILRVNFGNMVETIGEKVLPILNELAVKYMPMVTEGFVRFVDAIETAIQFTRGLIPPLSQIKGWVDVVKTTVMDFVDLTRPLWELLKKAIDDLWASLKFNLWPALQDLWVAMQPLMPVLEWFAKLIGVTIYLAVIVLTKALAYLVILLAEILKGWTGIIEFLTNFGKAAIEGAKKDWEMLTGALKAVVDTLKSVYEWAQKAYSSAKSALGLGGKSSSKKVDDAVISPSGSVVTTNPRDWLIATQNPYALAGASGGLTINIGTVNGTDRTAAERFAAEIARAIKLQVRV